MTLKDLLTKYFVDNSDEAEEALYEGADALWGYEDWKDKSFYHVSDFESFAMDQDISKPEDVDCYGGEDQGSTYYKVVKFTRGDETVFIKFYGYYASYNGVDYEGFKFVTPKQKMVVVYE